VKNLLLIGDGGHCRSCIDVIETQGDFRIAGIVSKSGLSSDTILGYKVLGSDHDLPELIKDYHYALITVGQIKSAETRIKIFSNIKKYGAKLPKIISPHAYVSKYSKIEEGSIVMHGAVINVGSSIGKNCIINTNSLIEHDSTIESHCHISTGAKLNGETYVGRGTFIGSGSVLHECVNVGDKSVISAGSIVRKNLPSKTIFSQTKFENF